MKIVCPQCLLEVEKPMGQVNRAKKIGAPLYCGRICSGLGRRLNLTIAQKKALKSEYDQDYRDKNREFRKQQRAEYYQRTRDPEKERVIRKAGMARHVEYCRRPEYREWKQGYDRKYRAIKEVGEFSEAYLLLLDIEKEVSSRMTRPEIYQVNERRGAQWRKRRVI